MRTSDAYLIFYNSACCVGWAMVWTIAMVSTLNGLLVERRSLAETLSKVYASDGLALMLNISQIAALLEILHALVGLVRSPVMVTAMQVSSRIVALIALVYSEEAQQQWGAGLMIVSWSSVEVPRYGFYIAGLATGDSNKKSPYPLFWLRYSLFTLLYPTGITGEISVFFRAAADPGFASLFGTGAILFYSKVLPIVYFFGSPFMIFNMITNRKRAMKKRFARAPPPPRGLSWPVDEMGVRSSTVTNKAVFAAAVGAVNSEKESAILGSKKWRFQYTKHLSSLVEEQCKSPESALKVAQAGLDKAYDLFEFIAPDGSAVSFRAAMAAKNTESFHTHCIKGEKTVPHDGQLAIPYKGKTLSGKALKDKIAEWVKVGTIEPSAGEAMTKCVDNPAWLKNISSRYFVLLGAGSAMGPLLVLMALGANIIAVDLDRPGIWKRLIGIAKDSPGSITFPMKCDPKTCSSEDSIYGNAGCNLFTHTPMIRDWLMSLYPGKFFTVGCYAYLDGALHVQVSLAMDAICRDLSEKREGTSLAYLCTPTDLHLIPEEAHSAQLAHYRDYIKRPYCVIVNLLSSGKYLRKNPKTPFVGGAGEEQFFYVNGVSVAQGPNYILAKRMQHWRAIIARSKGCIVSSNIAPSTSTLSVVSNRTFAWAYEGMPYFKPYEIFAPETSNAVMSAILFHDLNDPSSSGNPKTSHANPNQLFSYGSFHGGVWRCAYEIDSIGEASVFLYFGRVATPYAATILAVAVAGTAFMYSQ